MVAQNKKQQPLIGKVVSAKMEKTVVVLIEDKVKHKTYHKYVSRRCRLKAHDENNQCQEGHVVLISQVSPVSRHKAWKVEEILV